MGWFSAIIERHPRRALVGAIAVAVATAMATVLLVGMTPAFASHPEVSLAGSNFEIDTDANLKVDDPAPSIDWANVTQDSKADKPTGSTDDSFGQGTKEDTRNPTVVDGSIPNNKSDLLNFGVYLEKNSGNNFLNMYWSRVQEPTGTTNMDFEFNQSKDTTGNGVTPKRTAGDLLIQYDLSQGGTNPVLFVSRWVASGNSNQCQAANSTPCWGKKTNLTAAGDATGSINTSPIPAADSDGIISTGSLSARTFGEAQIDFNALTGGSSTSCTSFGSAYLKSRASDSFTAALKDFIAPLSTNISNCGSVDILKTDDASPANPLDGATFTAFKDAAPTTGQTVPGPEDTVSAGTCNTGTDGKCSISSLFAGEYWIVETTTPAGYDTADPQHATVAADAQPVEYTFVDPAQKGAIQVTKTAKHAGSGTPDLEATFTVKQGTTTVGTITTDTATGIGCLGDLSPGDYSVTETSGPTGYALDPDTETATATQGTTCSSGADNVNFENTPLSNITVSFSSQVAGGTASTISCTGLTADPADGTPNDFDDTSETFKNLVPGTYTCEVVVDP